jgi:hypothetical protein
MKLLTVQFCPSSCRFFPLTSKYYTRYPTLTRLQRLFLCRRAVATHTHTQYFCRQAYYIISAVKLSLNYPSYNEPPNAFYCSTHTQVCRAMSASYVVISFPSDVTANSSGHQAFFFCLVIWLHHMLEQNSDTHLRGMFSDDNTQLCFKMNSILGASVPQKSPAPPMCMSACVLVRISNVVPFLAIKAYMGSRGIALLNS